MTDSVIDRLSRDHRFPDVLAELLGTKIATDKTTAIRCLRPNLHKNGDAHPSMIVQSNAGGVACSCGLSLGLLDLVVEVGRAADRAAAAKWLEERYYGTSSNGASTNGHHPPAERPWPYYPKTAEALGWTLIEDRGAPALRCPTHAPDGKPGRTKVRRKKGDGPTATFLDDGDFIGLLGVPQFLEATETAETPTVALLAGETDLLAWTYHAKAEGIAVPGVSSAKGENSALGTDAALFRGAKVVVLYDADKVGREQGPQRAKEAIEAGAVHAVSVHVPKGKDVCEYLLGGGTVRELLRLAEPEPEPKKAELVVRSFRDILADETPEPEWLVHGLLGRRRLTLLTAAPKAGKSLAALGVAIRLASGMNGNWLGTDFGISYGREVLYLSGEGGAYLLKKRQPAIAANLPDGWQDRLDVVVTRPWPQVDTPIGLVLLKGALARKKYDLLVVDPLVRFRDVENENDNAETIRVAQAIREVAEDHDLAALIIHHPSKASAADREATTFGGGRGGGGLLGEVDVAISLRKSPNDPTEIRAYFELRETEPIEPGRRLALNTQTLWLDFKGNLGGDRAQERPKPGEEFYSDDRLVEPLTAVPGEWLQRDVWATRVGCSVKTLERAIKDGLLARFEGQVESDRGGLGRAYRHRWNPGGEHP